jgi:GNAT superfamily N-acetyltransferase
MVPILGFAEFMHRPVWTRLLREKVGSPDMIAMDAFYNIEPKSTMLVFEHKGEVSGVVALDGKKATQSLGTVLGAEEKQVGDVGAMERAGLANREGLRRRKGEESDFAQIRHLDVDHPVRRVGVATELLTAALDHAFKNVEKVVVMTNPFSPGGEKVFTRCGFKPVPPAESSHWEQPQAVGLFKWKGRWLAVTREDWVARRSVVSS